MAQVEQVSILLERNDGTVSLMSYVTRQYDSSEGPGWARPATVENVDAEIAKMMTLYPNETILRWRFMDACEVRPLRDFRAAWRYGSEVIGVDMEQAREIHREHLRALRAPQLAELDVEYLRAMESGDAAMQTAVTALKGRLRDVTADPRIDAATTPEELKAVVPDALKG